MDDMDGMDEIVLSFSLLLYSATPLLLYSATPLLLF
jgi:hypothetical protein